MDIFPTVAAVAGLPESVMISPRVGVSLVPVFTGEQENREKAIPFRHTGRAALIDNDFKLLTQEIGSGNYELYNLVQDPKENQNLAEADPAVAARLQAQLEAWIRSVDGSVAGMDYPEKSADSSEPEPILWTDVEAYKPYFEEWKKRPEYASGLE
jgi:arylsulfatase A-like enzyme